MFKVTFLAMTRTGRRLVKLFLGGQITTSGKSSSATALVWMVVETGLVAQLVRDCLMIITAPENPAMTTESQNNFPRGRLLVAI